MTKGKGKKQVKNTPKKSIKKQQAYKDPIKQIKKYKPNETKKPTTPRNQTQKRENQ